MMGTAFGVPDDIDEDELMGELDALEDDLAAETAGGGGVPAYLQVSTAAGPGRAWQPEGLRGAAWGGAGRGVGGWGARRQGGFRRC